MAKRYKLVETYPGSPELGTIHNFSKADEWLGKIVYDSHNNRFWKPIEQDWEILEFKLKNNDLPKCNENIVTLCENGYYSYCGKKEKGFWSLDNMLYDLEKGKVSIHKVKRLSDGEEFSIDDNIEHRVAGRKGNIISINLIDNNIYFSTTDCKEETGTILFNAIKINKLLFTTHDGVDIYDKDQKVYLLNPKSLVYI